MSVLLEGTRRTWRTNWPGWEYVMDLAERHGWEPKGTTLKDGMDLAARCGWEPLEDAPNWKGGYHTNDGQCVEADDAAAFSAALLRAVATLSTTDPLDRILDLAAFAAEGEFYIL